MGIYLKINKKKYILQQKQSTIPHYTTKKTMKNNLRSHTTQQKKTMINNLRSHTTQQKKQ